MTQKAQNGPTKERKKSQQKNNQNKILTLEKLDSGSAASPGKQNGHYQKKNYDCREVGQWICCPTRLAKWIPQKQKKTKYKQMPLTVGKLDSGSAASPGACPCLDDAQGVCSRQASSPRGIAGRRPGPGQNCHHHCSSSQPPTFTGVPLLFCLVCHCSSG